MRTVVISDTHLSHRFDAAKNRLLIQITSSADRVIINGDFWDMFMCSEDAFLNSRWERLFNILAEKDVVYLYGNHDPQKTSTRVTERIASSAGAQFTLEVGGRKIFIEHGHRIVKGHDARLPALLKRHAKIFNLPLLIHYDLFPRIFSTGFYNRYAKFNSILKSFYANQDASVDLYINGHTHFAEDDQNGKYMNSGTITGGHAWWIEIENDSIKLKYSTY